jgi:catechol 2,3-dioxygenase-like lactoylglutathione lyase family enzyme
MTIKDSNVTVMVKDMERSISFYQPIGFDLKSNSPGSGNTSIDFTVDNFEETESLLNELSINTQPREEEGGQFLHFADPDGTMLYFIKPKW